MGKDLRKMTRQEQVAYFKSKDFCGEELKVVMDAISYGISADYLQLFENTTLPIETMENMFTAMKEDYGVDSVSFLSTIQKGESGRIILEALKSGVPLQELKRVFQKDMLPVELREKILPLIQGREAIPEKIGEKMEFITEAVKELKESLLRQDSFIADLRKSMEEKQDIFSALQKGAETEAEAGAVDDAYYAGQGKKYTENTAHFSPEEKQGALRQKNNPGSGTGIQARAQMQMQSGTGRDAGDILADDISSRKSGSKKDKSRNKNTKKDNSHKTGGKSRKDRAAALRLLSYASDKFSMKEQKDSLLKAAGDLLALKIKAAAANALLSIGAALLPALIPAFIIVLVITLLFNSPFSILLPKLSEEPGAVEVLAEYTEDFKEEVQEELADPGSGDETELIYEDYEGDGEPDNMADILMVYMVRHGFGDTATVMTQKNKRLLKDTFDEMTSLNISYRTELREQPYEEEDFWGNVTIRTEEVEIKIKEVRITLLTSEDIIQTGIFTEEETEILRYLMSPEVLENIEGLTGGYGSPGKSSLTPEEEGRLNLGGDTGSQAVKNALARLGKPYSQAKRDSGDYYDCSSLTYYAYKEAGITLSYHGSNTAASQGQLLSDRGCEVAYEDIQPGDLIFYSFTRNGRYQNISHVAVYAGNGYLVDASSSKGCVVLRPVYSVGKIVMCGRPSWL